MTSRSSRVVANHSRPAPDRDRRCRVASSARRKVRSSSAGNALEGAVLHSTNNGGSGFRDLTEHVQPLLQRLLEISGHLNTSLSCG